ncbi:MAG: D-alanine--D-alanine ligase [Candidatus Omnitrophica bacterium]|nr:D-alanine--D-alanine ligase [Candidatus Omnitrophota bacterium]
MYNEIITRKIGVLAGGPSNERDISIKSGRAVYEALKRAGCAVAWIELGKSDMQRLLKKEEFDVAFIALHGAFGEDGSIQRLLKLMKKPYTGSGPLASKRALDKIASRRIFERNDIPFPEYRILRKSRAKIPNGLPFPLVVKPRFEGSSLGLSLARDKGEFYQSCRAAFRYSDDILVERFISGREITVGVLDRMPLPVVEIIHKGIFYDFNAKYNDKETRYVVPASLPQGIYKRAQALGLASHNALRCSDISRVDMLLDSEDNIYVLEVNSIPGLTERSLFPKAAGALGINFENMCLKLLDLAFKNNSKKV